MNPDISLKNKPMFTSRTCMRCNKVYTPEHFIKSSSPFHSNGYISICNNCIKDYLKLFEYNWDSIDKLCRFIDIPFIPRKYEELVNIYGNEVAFIKYADFFQQTDYESLNWKDYYNEFKKLKESGYIEDELPLLQDKHRRELQEKWGFNYDDEALFYLETLYEGLLSTQNITGALQVDQALKLCKISLELDIKIREGEDIDKMIASYDRLVKTAEFTPKNVKNASDFDSVGELFKWLEKKGWINQYYDNVTRDIVDETIKNFESFNQRLYTNESDIGEQITERLAALKRANDIENGNDNYGFKNNNEDELDIYDNAGYSKLLHDEEDEEFIVDIEEERDFSQYFKKEADDGETN